MMLSCRCIRARLPLPKCVQIRAPALIAASICALSALVWPSATMTPLRQTAEMNRALPGHSGAMVTRRMFPPDAFARRRNSFRSGLFMNSAGWAPR